MKLFATLFLILLVPFLSKAQSATAAVYNESSYVKSNADLGPENSDEPFTIWYKSTQDTAYALKKVFLDSSSSQLLLKAFYKANLLEGPFTGYRNGVLTIQGNYKAGNLDGERLTYEDSHLVQRAYFTEGINSGTWEEFDKSGKLIRRVSFDSRGKVASETKF